VQSGRIKIRGSVGLPGKFTTERAIHPDGSSEFTTVSTILSGAGFVVHIGVVFQVRAGETDGRTQAFLK